MFKNLTEFRFKLLVYLLKIKSEVYTLSSNVDILLIRDSIINYNVSEAEVMNMLGLGDMEIVDLSSYVEFCNTYRYKNKYKVNSLGQKLIELQGLLLNLNLENIGDARNLLNKIVFNLNSRIRCNTRICTKSETFNITLKLEEELVGDLRIRRQLGI